jgi:GNAT superfamily N-acetyltransferase
VGEFTLVLTDAPSAEDIATVESGLTAYNEQFGAAADRRPLCIFVKDDDGQVVGGVTGHTDRGWLYLDCFWLPEAARKGGWGGRILAAAEDEARARGCGRARLFTYSFQAQGFYEKHGYTVFGLLEDFPPGHRQIWLRKDLA